MKNKTKAIYFILIFVSIIMFSTIKSQASSSDLYLQNLDFQTQINDNGSMKVTETWNIDVEDTNTLFKTFKTDNTKYSGISDVHVSEIVNGQEKQFQQINEEMYHVTKDCYYGLKNSKGNFEIAWGVGLEDSSARKKYKIEYTVDDAIAKYNDYYELYWQFVGSDFQVNAKKITGTILLPYNVEDKQEIKVWGHTEGLNGTIYATDTNKVEFELDNFNSGRYVEIRTLFPNNSTLSSKRTYNNNIIDSVIQEETTWANEANKRREDQEREESIFRAIILIIVIVLTIFFITRAKKYWDTLKKLKKYEPTTKLEYYRELPKEDATPGESIFILKNLFNSFSNDFGKIFSATLLNLSLKKYIEIKLNKNEKGKEKITISVLKNDKNTLKGDEQLILKFIKSASKSKEEITMKQLESYIKEHSSSILDLIEKTHQSVKSELCSSGVFDKEIEKQYTSYSTKFILYLVFAGVSIFTTTIFSLLLVIVMIINAIMCYKIKNKLNVFTQKGIDEKEMWKGLKKYMEDFSLLKEREVPELVIWEKYLVYATAFGIADKVLKQLKVVYPNIDDINGVNTSAYMYFMYHSNFNTNFSHAINSSISSAYSSSTGGGGGFSGGGGGGRRPEVVEVVDSITFTIICL